MSVDDFRVPWGAASELPVEGRGFCFVLEDCTKGTGRCRSEDHLPNSLPKASWGHCVPTASPPSSPMNESAGEGERGLQWVGRAPLSTSLMQRPHPSPRARHRARHRAPWLHRSLEKRRDWTGVRCVSRCQALFPADLSGEVEVKKCSYQHPRELTVLQVVVAWTTGKFSLMAGVAAECRRCQRWGQSTPRLVL